MTVCTAPPGWKPWRFTPVSAGALAWLPIITNNALQNADPGDALGVAADPDRNAPKHYAVRMDLPEYPAKQFPTSGPFIHEELIHFDRWERGPHLELPRTSAAP